MATWLEGQLSAGHDEGSSFVYVSLGYEDITRTGTSVSFKYGVRCIMVSDHLLFWNYNSWTARQTSGGTQYWMKESSVNFAADTYYYAKETENSSNTSETTIFSYSGTVDTTKDSVDIDIYIGNNAHTPTNSELHTFTIPLPSADYSISLNTNNGTGGPGSFVKIYGISTTLPSTYPTRTGYDCIGWSASDSATSATWVSGGAYNTDSYTTLYAVWEEKTYTISYHANGGSGAPSSQTKYHFTTLVLSSTIPIKSNCNFLGWSTDSEATYATWSAGGNFTVNEDTLLYAVWSYNIIYMPNTPNSATEVVNLPSTHVKFHKIDTNLSSQSPQCYGYIFLGWGFGEGATIAYHQPGESYTVDSPYVLYAVWRAIVWIRVNGVYQPCITYQRKNDTYTNKITIGQNSNGGYNYFL